MNTSADFAERAKKIANCLSLIDAGVGEALGMLADLRDDYTGTLPWPAFCAEHFHEWGRRIDTLPSGDAGRRLEPWEGVWRLYSAAAMAQRVKFDAQWRAVHTPRLVAG